MMGKAVRQSERIRPIVALHGNVGSYRDWDFLQVPEVHAIDLWPHAHLSFLEFATILRDETESGSLLVGYSLGGRLALHTMAMYPEHWGGAVIISAHPWLCCVEDRVARRISDEIWAKHAREMDWPEFLEKWNKQSVLGDVPDSEKQLRLEDQRENIALAFENWSLGKQENLRFTLGRFEKPVLWITGEQDGKFTCLGDEMANVFPDFQHMIIPDCGHRILIDAPDQLAEGLDRFLK